MIKKMLPCYTMLLKRCISLKSEIRIESFRQKQTKTKKFPPHIHRIHAKIYTPKIFFWSKANFLKIDTYILSANKASIIVLCPSWYFPLVIFRYLIPWNKYHTKWKDPFQLDMTFTYNDDYHSLKYTNMLKGKLSILILLTLILS